jgi:hypothetical protein
MNRNYGPGPRPITGPDSPKVGLKVRVADGVLMDDVMSPQLEDAYWSANYLGRDYVDPNRPYADYRAAYRYGWEARARVGSRLFDDYEGELERGWDQAKRSSQLSWAQAKHAVSDAWRRIEHAERDASRRP